MTKRMLIDATHPEETRVAVVSGNRLEEYDYENIARKQLKGNIYLVKVTRVEPSLQAAFVDFGGNRHGFLPFPEIHPDYYRIPIADREALIAEERAAAAREAAREEEEDAALLASSEEETEESDLDEEEISDISDIDAEEEAEEEYIPQHTGSIAADIEQDIVSDTMEEKDDDGEEERDVNPEIVVAQEEAGNIEAIPETETDDDKEDPQVDSVGGDSVEAPVFRSSIKRRYKIQEVIKRNQIMLIQIGKEERGNKGAAVTSYISLPGRYCVLMPNSPRGGGVSRKVANAKDRQRLKAVLRELNVPEGMSVILRTAGVSRSLAEIKRDLDYLLRLWDQIRELTLKSTAPALIYEEGNLIKRAIRDLYRRDIDEVHVAGEEGYKTAREFMKTLMPSHVERVQLYNEDHIPLFYRYQVESQIDAIHSPTVHLKSGGYIVINPTEALVSIDVNSGRATKGRHIEETALKTNIEAAEEIARQVRLRDQGGLVVIDFIDMEDRRNNRIVEKKLRDAMQNDRARIQLGRISAFGLLELSRQRLHPSLVETNFEACKHCSGVGLVRTIETTAVMILRAIEEQGLKGRGDSLRVAVPGDVALYIFNHKRDMLSAIERKYNIRVFIHADETLLRPHYTIEPVKAALPEAGGRHQRHAPVQIVDISDLPELSAEDITDDRTVSEESENDAEEAGAGENRSNHGYGNGNSNRNRDRGRRGGRHRNREHHRHSQPHRASQAAAENAAEATTDGTDPLPQQQGDDGRDGNRRRGRRGGRRRGGRNRHRSDRPFDANNNPNNATPPGLGEQPSFSGEGMVHSEHTSSPAQRQHDPSPSDNPDPLSATAEGGGNRKGWWKRLTD